MVWAAISNGVGQLGINGKPPMARFGGDFLSLDFANWYIIITLFHHFLPLERTLSKFYVLCLKIFLQENSYCFHQNDKRGGRGLIFYFFLKYVPFI